MTPDALLREFARHLRVERGLSENTLLSYGYQIKGYLALLAATGKDAVSAGREDILAYLEAKKKSGRQSATLFACAIALRQFHRFLKEQGYAKTDASQGMRLPKFKQRLPEPLGVDEMEKLLSLPTGNKFHRICMKAALDILYSSGMRVTELVRLRLGDVNFDDGWVRVAGKGGRERIVPLGDKAKQALLGYLKVREVRFPLSQDTLFLNSRGRSLTRGAFWSYLRTMAKRVGIRGGLHPHTVRHSAASHMLAGGCDIRILQEYLGHANISVTQRYTHVNNDLLKSTCQKTHPRF